MLKEKNFIFDSISVAHRLKLSESDRQHLLIVFSGFRFPIMTGYDFSGDVHKGYKGHILWIKDDFNDLCTYYLCRNMEFSIENAVIALINDTLKQCGLQKNQCTLAGFSKGGTAALYFGIKYGFTNILSTVPQFNIGSYVSKNWQKAAKHMMREVSDKNIKLLDMLLPNLVDNDKVLDKNIYLFSSRADIQYQTEIEPNVQKFKKYRNFSFIMTSSDLVKQHNEVTRYNVPLILSTLYALCDGVVPSYGVIVKNGGKNQNTVLSTPVKSIIANLKKCSFEKNLFFPEGDAFILGEDSSCYGLHKKTLVLNNTKNQYEFTIGSTVNKDLSINYFNRSYIDYKTGGFASMGHNGIDLSSLDDGVYDLFINVSSKTYQDESALSVNAPIGVHHHNAEHLYYVYQKNNNVKLVKRPILGPAHKDTVFKVTNHWLNNKTYHIEGIFRVLGIEIAEWKDASYFLILKNKEQIMSFPLGLCHREYISSQYGDGFANYNKAYFSTMGGKGVDLSSLSSGNYEVYITLLQGNALCSAQAMDITL